MFFEQLCGRDLRNGITHEIESFTIDVQHIAISCGIVDHNAVWCVIEDGDDVISVGIYNPTAAIRFLLWINATPSWRTDLYTGKGTLCSPMPRVFLYLNIWAVVIVMATSLINS
jgi:hypothetical protein